MSVAEFLIIGGGVAGLSAAAQLSPHGRAVVLEAEEATGYHSSGRSATLSHYGIGNPAVRGLTSHSRTSFIEPPAIFEGPLSRPTTAMFVAREETVPALDALQADMARFTDTTTYVDESEMRARCPILKVGEVIVAGVLDRGGLKLDAGALMQGYARAIRAGGGEVVTGERVSTIARSGSDWSVTTQAGKHWSAPIIINAAGSWADHVATLAGVQPLGFQPKRRTIIVVDPAPHEVADWPFVRTVANDFYMLPEAGRLLASPADEILSEPCDAQPEEYDIALAAYRLEEYTTLSVRRVEHRWAGLRTFAEDGVPTAGFAPDAPRFFWLAGQGGYGLQTAPAMAEITEALILGREWPALIEAAGVTRDLVAPERLLQR